MPHKIIINQLIAIEILTRKIERKTMKYTILLKMGEIVLKGLNRSTFEKTLVTCVKNQIYTHRLGTYTLKNAQSTLYLTFDNEIDVNHVTDVLSKIFGFASICVAVQCEKNMDEIFKCVHYFRDEILAAKTFRVDARRSDKSFPLLSPEITRDTGEYVLEHYPHLTVDLHYPGLTIWVEIRDFGAYVHTSPIAAAGGLPAGSAGKGALLISGGIDSPVAGYLMARRGLALCAVHFFSHPYTSERALDKVRDLIKILEAYSGKIPLFIVPFTKIQEEIRAKCPNDIFTLVMRRFMMRISERIAISQGAAALVTGEALAQVASQTLLSLAATDKVVEMPVFRPVIGMDKDDIIKISRKIGTFETSILPYEDCCTVFTPKHPKTKPVISLLEKAETALDVDLLIDQAIEGVVME